MLIAVSRENKEIGYVQGMNFIAASLLYHCDEVASYWILNFILNSLNLNEVFQIGMNGFQRHLKEFEDYIKSNDQGLYEIVAVKLDGYSILEITFQSWIFTLFTSEIPLKENHQFL